MKRLLAFLVVSLCGSVVPLAYAQPWSPDSISLSVPGGGAQCSFVEVVMMSGLSMGHESTSVVSTGATFVEGWDEKCGWGKGPCAAGPGTGEWNPAIGYGGPLHLVYKLTSSSEAHFSVVWDDGHVGLPIYTTHDYPVAITPAGAKTAGLWSTSSTLPANGTATAALSLAATGPSCGALANTPVTLTTSHGRLRAGAQEGTSVTVTTGNTGRASATLVAATTAGTARITANVGGATAETIVRMLAKSLTITADPTEIESDGSSASIITVTTKDANEVPEAGQKVTITTRPGYLVAGPDERGPSVDVVTGPSGTATVSLTATGRAGTLHVEAVWGDVSAATDVEAVGYTIDLTKTDARYTEVPATEFGQVETVTRSAADVAVATLYGRTEIPIWVKVRQSPDRGGVVAGKTVRLRCAEADAAGSEHISLLRTLVTDSAGEAVSTLVVDDLWRSTTRPKVLYIYAEIDGVPGVSSHTYVSVADSIDALVLKYLREIPEGAIWQPGVWASPIDMSPVLVALRRRVTAEAGLAGLVNNAFAIGPFAFMGRTWQDQFKGFTGSAYQRRVLDLLLDIRHNRTASGQTDWWMNGIDHGPLFAGDGTLSSVVVYPRVASDRDAWRTVNDARILDPWFEQRPRAYTKTEYLARILPLAVVSAIGDSATFNIDELIEPANPLLAYYPRYGHDYPLTTPIAPARQEPSASIDVHCPVLVTIEDAQGRRSAYRGADCTGDPFMVREIAGVDWASVVNAAGTLDWRVDLPERPLTVRATAYADGPMTIEIFHRPTGMVWRYTDVPMVTDERASVVVDPAAAAAPLLRFDDGRTVSATVEPVVSPGVWPATGSIPGGTDIVVTGIAVTRDSQVWVGDVACLDAEWLNGLAIRCRTPRHAAGSADVRVTTGGVEAGVLSAAYTFDYLRSYFAEGATSTFFATRFAIANPGAIDASVELQYLKPDGTVVAEHLTVPAHGRATAHPEQQPGIESAEFSTTILSTDPVIADRTMWWDARGYGGHAETSTPAPGLTRYLAEGATHSGLELFYLLSNPHPTATAHVRVRYLRPSSPPLEKTYEVGPHSRFNIWVDEELIDGARALASTDVSAVIDSLDVPILVERAMYLSRGGQLFAAGTCGHAVSAPSTQWFLAEGNTGPYFDLFVLIANPGNTDAQVEATYLRPDGSVIVKTQSVAANSRFNIWVDNEDPLLADTAVSTTIRSTNGVPVIVERTLWWPGTYDQWYEAHNSPGSTATGTRWALADGEVGGPRGMDMYILLANTSASAGDVKVTLLFENGASVDKTFTVAANSRFNVDVRTEFPAALDTRFGAMVESLGTTPAQIVVERAMYWDAAGQHWAAGTNALATRLQ